MGPKARASGELEAEMWKTPGKTAPQRWGQKDGDCVRPHGKDRRDGLGGVVTGFANKQP